MGILLPVMPRREFRSLDGSSDQFWAITLEGERYTVQSGTIGTDGRTKTKKLKSPEAAQADYRKLVAEKIAAEFGVALPAREFQLVAGKSAKFWAIEVQGSSYTVRFGRIGTDGQTQTKVFDSPADARKACQKLIAEKLAKGYTEKATAAGSLLRALFSALAANPEDQAARMALTDYLDEQDVQPPSVAYRVAGDTSDVLESFLADPAVSLVQAVAIGPAAGSMPPPCGSGCSKSITGTCRSISSWSGDRMGSGPRTLFASKEPCYRVLFHLSQRRKQPR